MILLRWSDFVRRLHASVYRLASALLPGFVDDPAWLAFMFC
jgi:hypothetical protein